jgi:hypothetical protein
LRTGPLSKKDEKRRQQRAKSVLVQFHLWARRFSVM